MSTEVAELRAEETHLLILSAAGKPIYSRYGREDAIAGLCGVIQALVSVAGAGGNDALRSIQAGSVRAVFLARAHLILVAVSRSHTEEQLTLQLTYALNQIISVLTLSQVNRIFEQRRNYDLRRLLAGAERLVDGAAAWATLDAGAALGAVRVLPLPPIHREHVCNALVHACAPVRDLVFAVLLAGDRLVAHARLRKYTLQVSDLHLLVNLVRLSDSFRSAESWTPVCLPGFDATGFLHAHVSYLAEGGGACLVLLTVQRDAFYALSQAKRSIAERLKKHETLKAIDDALAAPDPPPGAPDVRHFMYKCRATSQLVASHASDTEQAERAARYASVLRRARPAKLAYCARRRDTVLAWLTNGFELYATLAPLLDTSAAILAVDRLLKSLKRDEERLLLRNPPTF